MQNNSMDLEENIENYNKMDNDKEELDKRQQENIDYLNYLNSLKVPNFDKVISEFYQEADLEDQEDSNDVDDSKINFFTELLKKLPDSKTSKEKKKRGNKVIKDGMGLLLNLDVTEPALLYHSYNSNIITDVKFFDVYLYSINISIFDKGPKYGFIFPINIGQNYQIKLYNRKTRKVIYADIIREKKMRLTLEQMKDVLIFHLIVANQLIRGKKNVDLDYLNKYEQALYKDDQYKKYFFVPIVRQKGIIEIEPDQIDRCKCFKDANFIKKYFPRISTIISSKYKKIENYKEEIIESLKNCFLLTDYKANKLYKFEDIIFKDDNLDTFINKYTFNNPELNVEIQKKLKEIIYKFNKKEENKINAKFIMEELYFGDEEEQQLLKESFGGILGYRKIPIKYGINLEKNNNYYLSCKFGPTNFCKQTNFLYNINILKTNLENPNEIIVNNNNKEKEEIEKFTKILPPDTVFRYYIQQNDIDIFEFIPSIFCNLEEILKVSQFIIDNNLTKDKNSKEIRKIEKNYSFLKWAFTLHSDVQDFNYETLETLGDSILKMLATTLVYHINELNDKEINVDKLVFGRKTLICNLHLYNKGQKGKIYNYIIRYPKDILNYSFPFENEKIKSGVINVSQKIIADIVESSIGGIFLLTKKLKDCFNYLIKLEIPFVEKDDNKYNETKGRFAKEAKWNEENKYKTLVDKSCQIMIRKMKNFDEFNFPENISELMEGNKIKNNINMRKLMDNYLMKCYNKTKEFKGVKNSFDYLQQCKIFYNFKDKKLLEQAMTHKSQVKSNSKNYEKLELLGDSIVEIFIAQYTFCIFSPYLFDDPNDEAILQNDNKLNDYEKLIKKNAKIFNNKYMTHVKSYLCSNYFMCKLSILIGLPRYIKFSENNINMKDQLKQSLTKENIENFLESPLNNYISTEIHQPKFIADLFESIIGAIYIDSDLKTTFEFLHLIYGPSICYSCLYLEELPFSIVADFTERCGKELKVVPSFKSVTKEEVIKSGLEYVENKFYLKLTIGDYFCAIDKGDSEEKAKENLSEKGMNYLEEIEFRGPA